MKNKLKKAKDLLNKSLKELKLYEKTKNFTYSSQSAEKCWVACNLIIEQKCGIELRTGKISVIMTYARKLSMEEVTRTCFGLHQYHYEGSQAYTEEELINEIKETIKELNNAIKYK